MVYLAAGTPTALVFALLAFIVWRERSHAADRGRMEKAFGEERGIWIRERRDLNNRIQVPQAAPFMDVDESPSPDDLPVLPDFEMDADDLERARTELQEIGYAEGPAL